MMDQEFNNTYRHIYFLGIGGISMSGLAEILLRDGFRVSGSDMKHSDATDRLASRGAVVHIGHEKGNITNDIDLLVYTAAVKAENPELAAAREQNIPVIDRAQLLGHVMSNYEKSIAVSGTHGKTTTTSMISEILLAADTDPTISVGGILPKIGGNTRVGESGYFVAEACEYFDSFLKFNPFIAIILNVEADHLDYFKDLSHIRHSFSAFAGRVPEDGAVVIHSAIENFAEITGALACRVVTFGLDETKSDFTAKNIIYQDNGKNSFDIYCHGQNLGRISLHVPGEHNITNALAAVAACHTLKIPMDAIIDGLDQFTGVNRRFQKKGVKNGISVIDDYAHHPTEIRATLAAAKKVKHHALWCVFQPHTYSRTKALLHDFSTAFADADHVIIADIFAAREKDTGEISAADLAEKIKLTGKDCAYLGDFSHICAYLSKNCSQDDLLITMGAGDVYLLGESFLAK